MAGVGVSLRPSILCAMIGGNGKVMGARWKGKREILSTVFSDQPAKEFDNCKALLKP